ncbi:MAG: glycosyltransferase family 39 protein [Lachnospiraceae bacterium]
MEKKNNLLDKQNLFWGSVFVFFIFMMLYNLTHSALWGDEWVEYNFSQASILNGDLYHRVIETFQPPLYNFIMHFWLKVNQSILWFRLFNVLLGIFSGGFLFLTVKIMLNEKAAAFSLCVLAVSYQWIYCIQECSEYALMLCCLFATLFFYVKSFERFTYKYMVMFILGAVFALYSQYGAVFVVLPLLFLFYVGNVFNSSVDNKRKIVITVSYIVCLIVFAAPLYFLFARKQLENNQISSNTVSLSVDLLKDFPFTLGRIIGYFYNLNYGEAWNFLLSIFSIILIVISIYLVIRGKMNWNKKSLIITLWTGYIMHYLLVQLHIYAMAHPNQSAGFFARYSYFYIPLISIVLPVIVTEISSLIEIHRPVEGHKYIIGAVVLCMILSAYSTLKNWNKALDDQFADIWLENNGWEDVTYLYGIAPYGFNYYVSHADGYKEGYLNNATTTVDNNNLPLRFWAWHTNWSGDEWQSTIDKAKELGYTVTIYNDSGYSGHLAFCSFDGMQEE